MSWLKMELDMESDNKRKPRVIGADANKDDEEIRMASNTYEIFMQPSFRDNIEAWRKTPLE